MSFIQKHKKVLAVLALVSFSFLTHVAAFPLKAETAAPAQQTVAASQDQPGAIEKGSPSGYYAKKKSSPIIPIIIGVVVVGAVAAVLILVVFKTKYDITGMWALYGWDPHWWYDMDWNVTFSGSKKSGTFIDEYDDTGTYSVDGKNVTFAYLTWESLIFTGTFTDKNNITGTYTNVCPMCLESYSGTLTLTRLTSSSMVRRSESKRPAHFCH